MTAIPVLGSTIGQIFEPLYKALAWMIAVFYAVIPNFAVAIGLLTVVVMIVTAPLTVKSTRSTIAMQRVAPELKKIQQKYKGDRVTLNEEMMKLYKEHNINPAGGCLPMLIQLPVFVVLYGVIRGLTNTVTSKTGKITAEPRYISPNTHLYKDIVAAHGHMKAFGLDLANNLFSHHSSWVGAIPYGGIVLVAIALQYLQMRQLNSRNPAAAQANPQMQMMQRYMPLVFAFIYLRISAGVNIYFVVSSLCRIGIQEAIFRSGVLDKAAPRREGVLPSRRSGSGTPAPRKRTMMERLADAQQRALEQQKARQAGLQAEIDKPRPPEAIGPGPRPATKSGTSGDGPAGESTDGETPPEQVAKPKARGNGSGNDAARGSGSNGTAKPPRGTPPKAKSSPNGAAGNGAPAKKPRPQAPSPAPPQGHPRSARKRPRKAR
ncbi:MAG TPA: membrane protein insertase YidC [Acidimicrobiales bacterium]|nr:membrane protein insertase YidC [Acidimicrobiales bacterium]